MIYKKKNNANMRQPGEKITKIVLHDEDEDVTGGSGVNLDDSTDGYEELNKASSRIPDENATI